MYDLGLISNCLPSAFASGAPFGRNSYTSASIAHRPIVKIVRNLRKGGLTLTLVTCVQKKRQPHGTQKQGLGING